MLKISIITPCFNSLELLKETAYSVLNQKACLDKQVELEYIIVDGGSTDGTVQWVQRLEKPCIIFISEKDEGLYDAVAKGLRAASGEIVSYLNCGDYYGPYTFHILSDVFSNPDVKWITGYHAWYDKNGYLVAANLPFRYRRNFILKGMYGAFLPYVQQESTLWRRELLESVNLEILSRFKLAGDYYLWHQFAGVAELHIVKAYLGGFREHSGQLSENKGLYKDEMSTIIGQHPSPYDYGVAFFDLVMWYLPDKLKVIMNPEIIIP